MTGAGKEEGRISIVIPNYNGAGTIGRCLDAALKSNYGDFEVIVVDDCSDDDSLEIIRRYPCKLIELDKRSGASKARNAGAANSSGEILFFIDSDCMLRDNALDFAAKAFMAHGPKAIIGGSYDKKPHDPGFFNTFQSVFINYSETKNSENPDYIATHAMIMDAGEFHDSGGFPEEFMPILEDVEFSHRMRRQGFMLVMDRDVLVEHVFGFSLGRSMRNAVRKSLYWTAYSISNRDLFRDSGTASVELKVNVIAFLGMVFSLGCALYYNNAVFIVLLFILMLVNMYISRNLLTAYFETGGVLFGIGAFLYYSTLYAAAVGVGVSSGIIKYIAGGAK